jgi:hypothetical protein
MTKLIDMTGQKFGRLIVLRREPGLEPARWLCRCDCGREKVVRGMLLRLGKTTSCGCFRREQVRRKDMAGLKFGRLTALDFAGINQHAHAPGTAAAIAARRSRSTGTPCGPVTQNRAAVSTATVPAKGQRDTVVLVPGSTVSGTAMIQRCYNEDHVSYRNYGARNVIVCEAWREDFAAFFRDMGHCPQGMSIDRKDPQGPYSPENCHWATHKEQNENRRHTVRLTHNDETRTLSEWATVTGLASRTIYMRIFRRGWPVDEALTRPLGKRVYGVPRKVKKRILAREHANRAVAIALRGGKLVKPPSCEHPGCDATEIEAHHHSYEPDKRLDVIWLCSSHHPKSFEVTLTWQGVTRTLREWSREVGIPRRTLYCRVQRNWSVQETLTTPYNRNRPGHRPGRRKRSK